mmetsp:Transcript_24002/g.57943  ORF Transcript_24002/g.57943 Transcript_24002/m.57943 type:complete len:1481 (+) Transcript_24002:367-4809(+)|eukprot:CAMPEP_0181084658 /NCGR_PEP_ID=MMETSP1071-20121207/4810_1 /TAXON_ID=35127 /ORGANISM="Thalassiosira sp., Strain NH16" /LENGTH=1480 /DNA_ID=CAMNT_0023166401 /DNA_START=298 /DNA_END=4740 /DNA_ORIENTATION=+
MTTLEEKQRELDALQTAFDEYIVSSRELEEELDAELTKCQNDVTKAESRNIALATQLANIQPQLTSLETKLSALTTQLSSETQRRISAEMKSEDAENKLRESEGTLAVIRSSEMRKLREENDDLYEKLAFVEGEAEDYRNELNTERERYREEIEETRGDAAVLRMKLREREEELKTVRRADDVATGDDVVEEKKEGGDDIFDGDDGAAATLNVQEPPLPPPTAESGPAGDEREEYIRTLEEELEIVTEQLIEAETKLSQTQAELEETLAEAVQSKENAIANGSTATVSGASSPDANNQQSEKVAELETSIELLREENSALLEESKRLKEELELALEELALSKEELDAYEEDRREQTTQFDSERKRHKEELSALQTKLDAITSEDRSRDIESKSWEEAIVTSKKEAQSLRGEVDRLEVALTNSKSDRETLQEEVEDLKRAFDESADRERAESEGQHRALEELLATRSREVDELQEEVTNLTDANSSLTKVLGDMEDNLEKQRSEIEKQRKHVASASASSSQELRDAQDEICSLQGLLEIARKELDEQRTEVSKVRSSLREKIAHAQTELTTAKEELVRTRSELAEVDKDRSTSLSSMSIGDADSERTKKMPRLSLSHVPLYSTKEDSRDDSSSPESEFYHSHALSRRLYSHKSRSRPRSCSPTTIQRLEGDAEQRSTTASSLQVECNRLENQNRMGVSMKSHLEDEIKQLRRQLSSANARKGSNLDNENEKKLAQDPMDIDDTNINDVLHSSDPKIIAKEVRSMAKKISAQKSHNAELLTRILKLQGNIQVCCRIRPVSVSESQRGLHEVAQSLSETEVGCFDERTRSWKSYAFDKVWGPENRQKDVFQDVEPMALSVIDGYNACIFAYGQTGSGKTYTMEGGNSSGQYGISQRTLQKVFSLLHDKAQQHQHRTALIQDDDTQSSRFEYKIGISMLEIYNDDVYDLLDPGFSSNDVGTPRKKALDIRHGENNTVEVPGLLSESVNTVSDVLKALDRGNSNRAKASTNLNEHSSRSHMVLRVDVTSGVGEAKNKGSLYLVDLAGSERVRKSEVEGKALKEAQHINKSLSALGNVMEALDRKASHIPYRDSKLTYLLQSSLGGNSRTMMVVTICPHNDSYDETTFALKFATRVRRINLGSAQKNVTSKNLEETVKNLTSEMGLLSKAKERSESQLLTLKREKDRVEDKLSKASVSRTNSKEEMRTLSVLRQTNNDITARWQKEKIIREEKTTELGKVQEVLQRVQRELRSVKREQDSIVQQNEDKENTIFQLKKDLRSMKDKLNEEKIRHRRSQVIHSRIPAPTTGTLSPKASANIKPFAKQSSLMKPPTRVNGSSRKIDQSSKVDTANIRGNDGQGPMANVPDRKKIDQGSTDKKKNEPNNVARIRARVIKMLKEHDPTKVEKIDIVMCKFEGRETELLEKMIARYEGGKDESKSPPSTASTAEATELTESSSGARPLSRQDMALARHMARMKRIRASSIKD